MKKVVTFSIPCAKPQQPGDVHAVAVDADGKFLSAQVCSSPAWAKVDLTGTFHLNKKVSGLLDAIVRQGAFFTKVKNLGWVIRNWQLVERFDVYPHPPVVKRLLIGDKVVNHPDSMQPDVYLVARLRDGRTYETGYSSLSVMKGWLSRSRTLRDVPITYHPKINAT